MDNDSAISVPIVGDDFTVAEGDPDAASTFTLTLDRFGSLAGSDTISVEIVSAGSNPAQESDLVNGFSSSQVTFAPGESTKTIEIPIAPDDDIEDDETFGVRITPVAGAATVPSGEIVFSIVDDDRTIDPSRQTEDNTLVIESGEQFNFEITKNITDVRFSRQLLAISVEGETPIFSTLGHPFGTQRTFAIDRLSTNVELQSGAFRFALQDPDGTITPLELIDILSDLKERRFS